MRSQSNSIIAQRLKVTPSYAVTYSTNLLPNFSSFTRPRSNKSAGKLSVKSKSRIRNAFDWMLLFAEKKDVYSASVDKWFKFRLNFCTVTLSSRQVHSDTYILHRMFFPLLKFLNRKYNVTNYVWRAEIQPMRFVVRGERCVHFHFVTDKFIHWKRLRNKWNSLQLQHGYISPDDNPNSTDVRSIIREESCGKYFSKYMSKKVADDNLKVTCKVYGVSRNLTRMNCTLREEATPDFFNTVEHHLAEHCTWFKSEKYFSLYRNKLTMTTPYALEISNAMRKNYLLFHEKSNGEVFHLLD